MVDAVGLNRGVSGCWKKTAKSNSHRRIATLKLRKPNDLIPEFDSKTHGSQATANSKKVPEWRKQAITRFEPQSRILSDRMLRQSFSSSERSNLLYNSAPCQCGLDRAT